MTKIEDAVYQALGEASVCWNPAPHGLLDSEHLAKIGEALLLTIRHHEHDFAITIGEYEMVRCCHTCGDTFVCHRSSPYKSDFGPWRLIPREEDAVQVAGPEQVAEPEIKPPFLQVTYIENLSNDPYSIPAGYLTATEHSELDDLKPARQFEDAPEWAVCDEPADWELSGKYEDARPTGWLPGD